LKNLGNTFGGKEIRIRIFISRNITKNMVKIVKYDLSFIISWLY